MNKASKLSMKITNLFSSESKKEKQSTAQITAQAAELEAQQEKARKEVLTLTKTSRLGFPYKPTSMAYDSVQHILAIGTKHGYVKLLGADSIEYTIFHGSGSSNNNNSPLTTQTFGQVTATTSSASSAASQSPSQSSGGSLAAAYISNATSGSTASSNFGSAVLFMSFVINEGALITYCDDSTLTFWNLRQKQPGVLFTRRLVNEKATAMHLPFQSNWIYIGTEKGNTYILNIYNNFSQSGYDIKWNNVIELTQKNKPGKIVHLSDCPSDSSKILIGYDSGLIVLWNLKSKKAEYRFYGTTETMSSISWSFDSKQFMSSHNNGSLVIWNCKSDTKPANVLIPHMSDADLIPKYNMVKKVKWEVNKNGEPLIIFADGLPSTDCPMKDAITIIRNNKLKTIIEMKERIVDFLVIDNCPWVIPDSPTDVSGIIVLLENNLVVIDLKTEGYPQFQHHHHCFSLSESPVTDIHYVVDPLRIFFKCLVASTEKMNSQLEQQKTMQNSTNTNSILVSTGGTTASTPFFSNLPYPISGGLKCTKTNIFSYNELLITGHEDGSVRFWDASGLGLNLIEKLKTPKIFDKRPNSQPIEIDNPFKITAIDLKANFLSVAAISGHVTLYKYNTKSSNPDDELANIPLLEIPISYDSSSSNSDTDKKNAELKSYLRTKIGFRRQQGFQPELVCLLFWQQRSPPLVNNVLIHPKNKILLFGTDESIVCVEFASKSLLLNISLVDLYGSQDPFHRPIGGQKSSPKKSNKNVCDGDDITAAFEREKEATTTTSHLLSKQATVDPGNAFNQMSIKENPLSRSSSYSSLENLSPSEGVSFLIVNEYAALSTTSSSSSNKNDAHATTPSSILLNQVWVGTTYGSVIVLNTILQPSDSSQNDNNLKPMPFLMPTGVIHSLKGQIVSIAFLDMSGNLIESKSNPNEEKPISSASAGGASSKISDEDLNVTDLDIDFAYLNNNQVSNSIAENFGIGASGSSPTSTTGGANTATPSAMTTGTPNLSNNYCNEVFGAGPSSASPVTNPVSPFDFDIKMVSKPNKRSVGSNRTNKPEQPQEVITSDKNHFAVLTSETQIKIISLPSQTCIYKNSIPDGNITRASVCVINSLSYLSCYLSNGSFLVFNLPNPTLKTNLSLNSQSFINRERELLERMSKTFTFGTMGHAMFMCSPNEIQKIFLSTQNGTNNLTEMLAEFFDPKILNPPAPKPNLFKSLFNSSTPLDREELFGESSGKPSTSIIKNVDGEALKVKKELTELQKLALERGEKLNALQLKSEEMTLAASEFAKNAHNLANKYKNKGFFK